VDGHRVVPIKIVARGGDFDPAPPAQCAAKNRDSRLGRKTAEKVAEVQHLKVSETLPVCVENLIRVDRLDDSTQTRIVGERAQLALIKPVAASLLPLLDPAREKEPPTDADDIEGMERAAAAFNETAGGLSGKGADDARRLAGLLHKMAAAPPPIREAAREALIPSLDTMLDLLRASLTAKKVTIASIPPDLTANWVSADGRARIEVAPAGDANGNATLLQFAKAVRTIDPAAMGEPIAVQESGNTVVRAFIEAGLWALLSISLLLFIVLRRISDVLLTLVPLLLAGVVTLEITVLIGLPLNFANIIALPLLLGLGVAFKIYFVMAWRAGTTNLLQSSLTRAVFFSAMTTATAFGSLWMSKHPGTSSMGKLLALSLVCTLAAAILFQPALMGPPRNVNPTGEDA